MIFSAIVSRGLWASPTPVGGTLVTVERVEELTATITDQTNLTVELTQTTFEAPLCAESCLCVSTS